MSLGMEVSLGPGDFVLDGDPALYIPKKGSEPPIFGRCLLWPNGWMHQDGIGNEVGLGPCHIVLYGDPVPSPKRGHSPQFLAHGRMDQDAT